METQNFFSHGKLLITSEYFVLDGSKALAIPTKLGQKLSVTQLPSRDSVIHWQTYREGVLWLDMEWNYRSEIIQKTNQPKATAFIQSLFKIIKEMGTEKLNSDISYYLKSEIEFPEDFGLGSSSTLISNVARWAKVDAFELNERLLGGSGYDIAVAEKGKSICYKKSSNAREIELANFNPPFADQLLFVHLNRKQNTREGIKMYRNLPKNEKLIHEFSLLTEEVLRCDDLENFSHLMEKHERLVSNFLKIETIKEKYLKNAPVFVKSLGAWGGDFIMTAKFDDYHTRFSDLGFDKIFTFKDLIHL